MQQVGAPLYTVETLESVYQFVLSEKQTTKMESELQSFMEVGNAGDWVKEARAGEVRESWTAIQSDTYPEERDIKGQEEELQTSVELRKCLDQVDAGTS